MYRNWYSRLLLLVVIVSVASIAAPVAAQTSEASVPKPYGVGNGVITNKSSYGVWVGGEFKGGGSGNEILYPGQKSSDDLHYQDVDHVWASITIVMCDVWHDECHGDDYWYKISDNSDMEVTNRESSMVNVGGQCPWFGCYWEKRPQ
ncbi:MAG: hypothetical protein MI924_18855 [Chloroflexales bacterium]|nr:hypothetical protein [Chloroflexales bacterium]